MLERKLGKYGRQAHQTMAAGITEPAAIDLFGIAKEAIKKVAPIP